MSYTLPEPYDSVFWEGKIVDVFRPEQMQAAFDAGRASRDGEVEALKQELNQVNIERLKWKEWTEKAEKEVEALKADAVVDAQILEKLDSRVVELNEQLEAARIYQETVLALQEKQDD